MTPNSHIRAILTVRQHPNGFLERENKVQLWLTSDIFASGEVMPTIS